MQFLSSQKIGCVIDILLLSWFKVQQDRFCCEDIRPCLKNMQCSTLNQDKAKVLKFALKIVKLVETKNEDFQF